LATEGTTSSVMKNRLRFNTARELYESFPTAAEDIKAAPTDQPCLDFLRALATSETPEDAITFCAYMLPRRVAVWWGHQCLTRIPEALAQYDPDYLAVAEAWVREPEEDRRYAALDAGMASGVRSPAVWICLAAGWSGGSLAPSGMAPVVPPPFLTARGVNAGILSALSRVAAKQRAATLSSCVAMGISLTES
jgi:hypothetical protein